MAARIVGG